MGPFSALTEAACKLSDRVCTEETLAALSKAVPGAFTLETLEREIVSPRAGQEARATVLALHACLQADGRLEAAPEDAIRASKLGSFIGEAMAPTNTTEDDRDDGKERSAQLATHSHRMAEAGLPALQRLLARAPAARLANETLLTLAAFADPGAAWSTPETSAAASDLLRQQLPDEAARARFVAETVLQSYLRPLFSRSRPATVTAAGRRAEYVDREREGGIPDDSRLTKPWKYQDLRAVPVLAWVVAEANAELVAQHWPLFIPVLLTLVDDSTTDVRARGLATLAAFLRKFPGQKLRATGLATVFEEAIFPTLLYLPSITPVDESLRLLEPAYDALFALASQLSTDGASPERKRLLDKMLREGILTAYFHARDHMRIVELLFRQTVSIVALMGINSVKHLKGMIPMVSAVMTDPFAPASPSLLLSAIAALQAILANAWPRISDGFWKDEILNALVLAWLSNNESAEKADDRVASELVKTTRMLSAIMEAAQSSLASHAAPLVSKEPALKPLFVGSS